MPTSPNSSNNRLSGSYFICYDIQRILGSGVRQSICLHGPRMPGGFGRLVDAEKVRAALYKAYLDAGTTVVLEIVPVAVAEDFAEEIQLVSEPDEADPELDYMSLPPIRYS